MKTNKLIILTLALLLIFSCKKDKNLASLETTNVINITDTTVTVIGKITNSGNSEIICAGVVWSQNSNPSKEDNFLITENIENLNVIIPNLSPLTKYYVRIFAENEVGISYGNELEFTTTYTIVSTTGSGVTDIEGNFYQSIVLVNGQEWMAENLRTSTCSNGTPIPNVENNNDWGNLNSPAWAHYQNNSNFNTPYGKLYNWYAAVSCDICPSGWRVPSEEDWYELRDYLDPQANLIGGINYAGSKMKTIGTEHWKPSNNHATNESKFSSIPGGFRNLDGAFNFYFHSIALYWSSSNSIDGIGAIGVQLQYSSQTMQIGGFFKVEGLNIRCLKN